MEKRVFEFRDLEELIRKMDGKRKVFDLRGYKEKDWVERCYFVEKNGKVKAVFINAWSLEYQV